MAMIPSRLMPQAPYEALIFDCDGTLANTTPIHYQAWSAAIASLGGHLPRDWYYDHAGISTLELVSLINQTFGYAFDPQHVKQLKHRKFVEFSTQVTPVPEVLELVMTHAGKVKMAIASGGSRANVEATLKALKCGDKFDAIVTIEDVTKGKPEPELFLLASQRLVVDPALCVVYEDTDVGILAAQRAGMKWVNIRDWVQRDRE